MSSYGSPIDRADDALEAFDAAIALNATDGYILYNRSRANLALGRKQDAHADFTAAANPKLKQPGARKLALSALAKME